MRFEISQYGYKLDSLKFTSDTHFFHTNIIKYCDRPFSNCHEMNEVLIENWNKAVRPNDLVIHNGDFGFFRGNFAKDRYQTLRKRLNGKILLLLGNHDRISTFAGDNTVWTHDLVYITAPPYGIVNCHYSLNIWEKRHYGSWHLFGHSHGVVTGIGKSFDVGVDTNKRYAPYCFEEIKTIMDNIQDDDPYSKKDGPLKKWKWLSMDSAPKDNLILLCFEDQWCLDGLNYGSGFWDYNYGCSAWRVGGSFVSPVAWMPIQTYSISPPEKTGENDEKELE